ncbi:G-D-S-L family lipolytic protein [Flavobacterium sp. SM15]|uniref:G-D-S-L family lipolytic protein n=1 Tax=Flavobacterium sp. SM15 TaxID=2908005 RepID=UPI001EDA2E19|nr:G-D-S-L family lipolytic protein [Flavobacterium sp. SM15]MCG2610791.1 G-D-S-L family lipolytic protein [Flavobacterium sp. SM15]
MKNKFIYLAVLAALGFASCEPEFDNEVSNASYSAGEADFSRYVAVGNSLTAGYMDGTVSRLSQANSYPSILAKQFALVGGGEFTQPDYSSDVNNIGGLNVGGNPFGLTRYVFDATERRPERAAGTVTLDVVPLQAKAYNNMGVPGAKTFHLLYNGYGNLTNLSTTPPTANPYFVRHAVTPTSTVLGDAMSKNPTFFTNWIGSNDVLLYALDGADATVSGQFITPAQMFKDSYDVIIGTLSGNGAGAKGVVATIPDVTSIPYFTTVPYKPVSAAAINANPQAPLLVGLYQFLAVATSGRIAPLSTAAGTSNPVIINDETLPDLSAQISAYAAGSGNPLLVSNAAALGQIYGRARQTTSNDMLVLPSSSVIGTPSGSAPAPFNINGLTLPLGDRFVLIPSEKDAIAAATLDFNNYIKGKATLYNLALADMNAIMQQLTTGLKVEDGQVYTANYFNGTNISSVLFSLDGIHPNSKGYAVIANEIIKVINSHYKSKLPLVSASNYPGITIVPSN